MKIKSYNAHMGRLRLNAFDTMTKNYVSYTITQQVVRFEREKKIGISSMQDLIYRKIRDDEYT